MTWLAEDKARLKRFREGDPQTLKTAYYRYGEDLMRVLAQGIAIRSRQHFLSCFSDPFLRDEIVQETFIRAFGENARRAYDGCRPYKNYLFAIARNVAVDVFKKRSRTHGEVDIEVHTVTEPGDSSAIGIAPGSPEEALRKKQLQQIIDLFVQQLKPSTRQLWQLRYEEGMSRPEISERLGLSEMQIRSREKKIRTMLHKRLVATGYRELAPPAALALLLTLLRTQ